MDDSVDVAHAGPQVARLARNVYVLDDGSNLGRPGCQTQENANPTRGGAGGSRTPQCHFQLTTPTGTEITGRIVGGKLEVATWTAGAVTAWTNSVTAANFATAAITVDPAARIAVVPFAGKLIFSDGVNKPWSWTGAAGAGGLVSLTAASVWYGVPVVRDAQIMGIQNADRRTIEWSAVNDPASGYGTQTWTLAQLNETPITALVAFNDVLIVFRERSMQPITGRVNATFSTSATRSTLSESVGTKSPFAVVVRHNRAFFIDADGRPRVVSASAGSLIYGTLSTETPDQNDMWRKVRETCRTVDRSKLTAASAVLFHPLDLVLLGVARTADANPALWFVIDGDKNAVVALWDGFEFLAPAVVKDGVGAPQVMFGDANGYTLAYADTTSGSTNDDNLQTGTVAVQHQVDGTPLQPDGAIESYWNRCDVRLRSYTTQTLGVSFRTPNGQSAPQAVSVVGNSFILDVAKLDVGYLGDDPTERHKGIGMGVYGRWIAPVITHATVGEQFGVVGVQMSGASMRDDPPVK